MSSKSSFSLFFLLKRPQRGKGFHKCLPISEKFVLCVVRPHSGPMQEVFILPILPFAVTKLQILFKFFKKLRLPSRRRFRKLRLRLTSAIVLDTRFLIWYLDLIKEIGFCRS